MENTSDLEKLTELLRTGAITHEEYGFLKQELQISEQENPKLRSYSIEDTKNRLAHKHKEEPSKSNHSGGVSFISRSEFEELKQKAHTLETALTDSSRYVKEIYWCIIIQLLLAFLYFFVLGFIIGYGRYHSSILGFWFFSYFTVEYNMVILKYIFDLIIIVISMYILYCIHALGQSLGYLKKKK